MFNCETCSASFTRKDSLIRHQKKHEGVRFSCTMCISTFSRRSTRTRHMKNIHGMNKLYLIKYFSNNLIILQRNHS